MRWGIGLSISVFSPPSRPDNERAREGAVRRSGAIAIVRHPRLQAIVGAARRHFGTSMSSVSIVYEDWQYVIAGDGMPTGPSARRTSMCGHAILEPDTIFFVADAMRDPRFAGNPATGDLAGIRFYAGAPILYDGLPIGMLCIIDAAPRADLSDDDRRRLSDYAGQVAQVIATRYDPPADADPATGADDPGAPAADPA